MLTSIGAVREPSLQTTACCIFDDKNERTVDSKCQDALLSHTTQPRVSERSEAPGCLSEVLARTPGVCVYACCPVLLCKRDTIDESVVGSREVARTQLSAVERVYRFSQSEETRESKSKMAGVCVYQVCKGPNSLKPFSKGARRLCYPLYTLVTLCRRDCQRRGSPETLYSRRGLWCSDILCAVTNGTFCHGEERERSRTTTKQSQENGN
jgi:hypothetical protein